MKKDTPELYEIISVLEGFLYIVQDSDGVGGYHLNGNLAYWDEFEEVAQAQELLEKIKCKVQ